MAWQGRTVSGRPQWTKHVRTFLNDTIIDEKYGYPFDGSDDDVLDAVEQMVNDFFCNLYGHEIEDDMCMKHEHRYCPWCNRRESQIRERDAFS